VIDGCERLVPGMSSERIGSNGVKELNSQFLQFTLQGLYRLPVHAGRSTGMLCNQSWRSSFLGNDQRVIPGSSHRGLRQQSLGKGNQNAHGHL
jgi:hypothetical protein